MGIPGGRECSLERANLKTDEKRLLTDPCCLENLVDREAWQARVNRMAKESDIIQQLNNKNRGKSMFRRRKGMDQG